MITGLNQNFEDYEYIYQLDSAPSITDEKFLLVNFQKIWSMTITLIVCYKKGTTDLGCMLN